MDICRFLKKRGHDVSIARPMADKPPYWYPWISEIKPIELSNNEQLSKEEYDVCIIQDPSMVDKRNYIKAKLYVYLFCSGFYPQVMEDQLKFDNSIACAETFKTAAHTEHPDKVYYIGHGVDTNIFKPFQKIDMTSLDKQIFWNGKIVSCFKNIQLYRQDKVTIIFNGRGGCKKMDAQGCIIIEQALNYIGKEYVKKHFNMVAFENAIFEESYGYDDKYILYLPWVENHRKMGEMVYSIADIVLTPNTVSCFNCVAGEAMACKKSLICSNQGTEDIALNNINALVYPANNYKILAEHLLKLEIDKVFRDKLAMNAYGTAMNNFSLDKVAERIEFAIGEYFENRMDSKTNR